MKYIVVGHGRTGTHFVIDILTSCFPGTWEEVKDQEGLLTSALDDVVLHSNNGNFILEKLYKILYESARVIYVYRKGTLALLASLAVAEKTEEWNYYTNLPVEPFEMDVKKFLADINGYYKFHRFIWQELQLTFPPERLDIFCYEDILAAEDPRLYVCEKLGLHYIPLQPFVGPLPKKDIPRRGRNPRNYREIITNYAELEKAFEEHFKQNLPPWVSQ